MEYDERLSVPLRWWVQGTMLVASLWLAVIVALPEALAWTVTVVAAGLMVALFAGYGAARITVGDGELRVGRAHVEARHLGTVVALDAEAARRRAGVGADARAYLLLRPYLKQAVQVEIADPADPTPYWLVSTRHPRELAAAVDALTRSGRTG